MSLRTSPHTALDVKEQLLRTARITALRGITPGVFAKNPEAYRDCCLAVQRADVYWWTRETSALVHAASRSYPVDKPLAVPDFAAPLSLHVFEDAPLRVVCDAGEYKLIAVLAGYAKDPDGNTVSIFAGFLGAPFSFPIIWSTHNIEYPISITGTLPWMTDNPGDTTAIDELIDIKRFCMAAGSWLRTRILTETVHRPARAERRRIERAGQGEPAEVRVVAMRRRESGAHGKPEGDAPEHVYDHRWCVSGHWRNQFYPSTGEHLQIYINPYIKGPESAPLKPASSKVFYVGR